MTSEVEAKGQLQRAGYLVIDPEGELNYHETQVAIKKLLDLGYEVYANGQKQVRYTKDNLDWLFNKLDGEKGETPEDSVSELQGTTQIESGKRDGKPYDFRTDGVVFHKDDTIFLKIKRDPSADQIVIDGSFPDGFSLGDHLLALEVGKKRLMELIHDEGGEG